MTRCTFMTVHSNITESIHIISNDIDFCNEIHKLLTNQNYSIKTFNDISKFMEISLYQAPSCLITTLEVAENNRFSLIESVQTKGLSIPVIIIAKGNESVYSIVNAMKAGAADLIYMPLFINDFIDTVTKVIRKN